MSHAFLRYREKNGGAAWSHWGRGCLSKEICGGPHATNTSELGEFVITKEQSSSSGVRRIKAELRYTKKQQRFQQKPLFIFLNLIRYKYF